MPLSHGSKGLPTYPALFLIKPLQYLAGQEVEAAADRIAPS